MTSWLDEDEMAAWLPLIRIVHALPQALDKLLREEAGIPHNYYGMLVYFVEPDFDKRMPVIRTRSSKNVYAIWDGFGDTILAAEEWEAQSLELCEQFPGLYAALKDKHPDG